MDPAVKAAADLNAIFGRLEVSCEVCVSGAEGKHVKATTDLAEGFALVEEMPIVSWPSAALLTLHQPFCFHCLRLTSHQLAVVPESSSTEASSSVLLPEKWTRCGQCSSCFCSPACAQASARVHRLLCSSLPQLREGEVTNTSAAATAAAIRQVNSGISVEALARCVAWVVHRLSTVLEQQAITHDMLQADYTAQILQQQQQQHASSSPASTADNHSQSVVWSADSLNYQLFTQVVTPFSRLISPPDSVNFDGVSLTSWTRTVRTLLADKCVKVLLMASKGPLSALKVAPMHFAEDEKGADGVEKQRAASRPTYWAEALMQILFSADTLRTLVGQMVLNAHGVNDYVLPCTSSSAYNFQWILKGAGLYALLSSFNHSCEPNAVVSNVEDTHEIVLKTTRPIQAGEEITITYIPLTEKATVVERQQMLKNYFFTCRCPRCVRESKA